VWRQAARLSLAFEVEGHRADVVMIAAATAFAALDGRGEVGLRELGEAASMALPHRSRRDAARSESLDLERLERAVAEVVGEDVPGAPAGVGVDGKKNSLPS
jgi:Mg-chelatase subunit ChlI